MNQQATQPRSLTDADAMPFGKYIGKRLIDVPAIYLLWLYNKGVSHDGVKQYILNNLDALRNEAKRVKR